MQSWRGNNSVPKNNQQNDKAKHSTFNTMMTPPSSFFIYSKSVNLHSILGGGLCGLGLHSQIPTQVQLMWQTHPPPKFMGNLSFPLHNKNRGGFRVSHASAYLLFFRLEFLFCVDNNSNTNVVTKWFWHRILFFLIKREDPTLTGTNLWMMQIERKAETPILFNRMASPASAPENCKKGFSQITVKLASLLYPKFDVLFPLPTCLLNIGHQCQTDFL